MTVSPILPTRRYASASTSYGPVSLCVCLSQVGVLLKRLGEWGWFLARELSQPILHCVIRKFGYLHNKGTSLRNFAPISGLRKFRHGIPIVETCYQPSSRRVDAQSVINRTVVDQLSWQCLLAPTLVHYFITVIIKFSVSTARFRRAGSVSDSWCLYSV